MNARRFYRAGNGQDACRDFALAGESGSYAYAITCDGDSQIQNHQEGEFGVRALAMAARETIQVARRSPLPYEAIGSLTIGKASTLFPVFPSLNPRILDASLSLAWVQGDNATVCLYGDGLFFHRAKSITRVIRVRTLSPAPPWYLSQEIAEKDPEKECLKEVLDCVRTAKNDESGTPEIIPCDAPVMVAMVVDKGDVLGVVTNGIEHFMTNAGPLDWREALGHVIKAATPDPVMNPPLWSLALKTGPWGFDADFAIAMIEI
jgi:hypothetical protein